MKLSCNVILLRAILLAITMYFAIGCSILQPGKYTLFVLRFQNTEVQLDVPRVAIYMNDELVIDTLLTGVRVGGDKVREFRMARGQYHIVVYVVKNGTEIETIDQVCDLSKRFSEIKVAHVCSGNLHDSCRVKTSCFSTNTPGLVERDVFE